MTSKTTHKVSIVKIARKIAGSFPMRIKSRIKHEKKKNEHTKTRNSRREVSFLFSFAVSCRFRLL